MNNLKSLIERTICACLLIISIYNIGASQSTRLKGTIIDSTTNPLVAATVVLLQPQDSVMVSFALSDNQGRFTINNVNPGDYYLQITYIGYGNYRQNIKVEEDLSEKNLGTIFLSPKNTLLEEVVVKAEHVPIIIKKDTIEYNADAFKTKPNAVVEDLLKRLPGVEVERDGSIKAQGEDVENVLVDGKEFFGSDPTIATQNLPADIVDKVQVYDKQSEMAEFTGVDDGQEEKTINLSLKEDKKKGYFGNVKAGYGAEKLNDPFTNGRYQGKLSINRFDSKLQLSILGMANNNNDRGFSFNDYINFMGGMGSFMSGGSMSLSLNSSDMGIPLGYNNSPGITKTAAGGLNFNFDFSDKTEWQSSYFINRINNSTVRSSTSETLSDINKFSSTEESDRDNINLNHRLNTSLKIKIDSSSQISWRNRLSFNTGDLKSSSVAKTFNALAILENQSQNALANDGDQFSWFTNFTLRKKLSKRGRVISANVNANIGDVNNSALVENETEFFENGQSQLIINNLQDQLSAEDQNQYGLRLTYTEPIAKRSFIGIEANRSNYVNERSNTYYDLDPNNPSVRTLNILLSNQFERNYTFNRFGSNYRYVGKKLKMNAGLNYQQSQLDGDILSEDIKLSKDFSYLLPSFSLDYEMGNSRNIEFMYRTNINEPTLEQLQPTVNNSNPLNQYFGNPDLKPEYIHSANAHLMLYDQFTFTSFFANLSARYINNRIVNKSTIDDQFRQIITPINTDKELNTSLYASFSTPLKFMKSKVSIDANVNYTRGILFVNDLENNTDRWTNNYTLTLENRKKELIDIAVGLSLGTNNVKYSESSDFNQSYFDQTYFTDLTLYLPKSWNFESSFDMTTYSEESFGDQDDLYIWQASLSKSVMAGDRLTLELSVYDILDQNKGIRRSNSFNYIQESVTNVLGRYVLFSLNYKLSQFGGNGGFHIEVD